jgi:nucleoside-diphosphate-sugar epimerase
VTGAGGFFGSHLVERLAADGAEVRAFVEYDSRGSWGWLDDTAPEIRDGIEIIAGDIRDSHAVRQAMAGCEFEVAGFVCCGLVRQGAVLSC